MAPDDPTDDYSHDDDAWASIPETQADPVPSQEQATEKKTPQRKGKNGPSLAQRFGKKRRTHAVGVRRRNPTRSVTEVGQDLATLTIDQRRAATLAMAVAGQPTDYIAKVLGVSERCIDNYRSEWANLLPNLVDVTNYKHIRDEIFTAVEATALRSLAALLARSGEEMALKDLLATFKELHRAGRLERGESTSNVAQQVKHSTVVDLSAYRSPSKLTAE